MNEEIKAKLEIWILRVLERGEKANPEELRILPDLINILMNCNYSAIEK